MARKIRKFDQIKEFAVRLYQGLLEVGVHSDMIILFGSVAKGTQHQDSDIDFCVVSRNYGKDPVMENARANMVASKIDTRIEVRTASLDDYMKSFVLSPILYEIKKTGICIL
jgi:predicted nucleotidyltransferase